MSDTDQRKRATSLEEVDIHLDYLRIDMRAVLAALPLMATKDYIDKRFDRFEEQYTSKAVTDAIAGRVAAVESKLDSESIGSTFDRFLSLFTRIGAAVTVLIASVGGLVVLVHWFDRVPK